MNSASLTLNFSDKRWTAWDTRSTTHDESFFQMWSRHSDDAVVAMCDDGGHVQGWTYKVLELFCSHHCRSRKPEFGFAGFNTVLERQVHFLYFQLWICEFSCGEVALGKELVQVARAARQICVLRFLLAVPALPTQRILRAAAFSHCLG